MTLRDVVRQPSEETPPRRVHLRIVKDAPAPPLIVSTALAATILEEFAGILPAVVWYYQHRVKQALTCRAARRRRPDHEQMELPLDERHPQKARSIGARRLSRKERRAAKRLDKRPPLDRPVTRAECANSTGLRPCPFVGCRHNYYLDVNPRNGSIKLNFPGIEPGQMRDSCVLDFVGQHPHGATLDVVALRMNLTMERARQLEAIALGKLARAQRGLGAEYLADNQ